MAAKKRKRRHCEWAKNLKNGKYTLDDLVAITNQSRNTLQKYMKNHCKVIDYLGTGPIRNVVYHWVNKFKKEKEDE